MTLLERLKELNATTGKRNADEDLAHWADREKDENLWVRDIALPDLLAVVEAAKLYLMARDNLYDADSGSKAEWIAADWADEKERRCVTLSPS